jgi:hypothetical protein
VSRGTTILPAALAAVAVSAVLAGAVVELARVEALVARHRHAATDALAAVDACLAEVVAAAAPAVDLRALLAGPDGVGGTADDGRIVAPAGCTALASAPPGPAAPPRALVRVTAAAHRGRRSIDAVVGLERTPGVGTLVWLAAAPATSVSGTVTLDGADAVDPHADSSSLAAPGDPVLLEAWSAAQGGHVVTSARTGPPISAPAPPFGDLVARARASGAAGAGVLVPGPPAPALALVPGNLAVPAALRGIGVLIVDGDLAVTGSLDYAGVVVVSGRLTIPAGGRLAISGGLWVAAAGAPFVDGDLAVTRDASALATADALLPLPRRPVVLGLRDLG